MKSKTFKQSRHTASKQRHEAKRRDARKARGGKRHHEKYRQGKQMPTRFRHSRGARRIMAALNAIGMLAGAAAQVGASRKGVRHVRKSA